MQEQEYVGKTVNISSRNGKVLVDFIKYCQDNPEQRFWQALRNWSGFPFILAGNYSNVDNMDNFRSLDTFYFENRND